ncbi:hypothetical protein EDD29_2177 [Actinocorallia herbida]|uniref:Uncharacterized protein n=1 Tax=Actinocorallia herbida TaxID=58109 RepID=A0A3N1CTL9_9ACTN|nr:hypothetical protein [Actinocorallia herbida]ROO84650.1 hypothetical protein EDD29_2177 [Actinocorallia herbida]
MTTDPATTDDAFAPLRALADAILYEGYLLYPYRRSSAKNRVRWQFGVLTPRAWTQARGPDDTGVAGSAEGWWQRTEALVRAPAGTPVEGAVRFLQVQRKTVEEHRAGRWHAAESLTAAARHEVPFDEAVPHEIRFRIPLGAAPDLEFTVPGGRDVEEIADPAGRVVGRVVRERLALAVRVGVGGAALGEGPDGPLHRLSVRVANAAADIAPEVPRDTALRSSPLACHLLLAVRGGAFVSLLDPPEWAEAAVRGCANVHTFPVLADAADTLVLSSPILLYDHPKVAPESPGDLHDSGEIDEILTLRTLTLTDAEKREARATDPRAAAIVDRADAMPPEVFERLHGAVRSLGAADRGGPPDASVVVAGVRLRAGSRVRLRPRRHGTDPQDRFLDGRTARVEKVLADMDDATHLAVTVEDDPAADLDRWYGRFRYFAPDEVEPLEPAAPLETSGEGR